MTDTPRLWDRRADETPKSYAAFRAYVALGARRSVREAARQHHSNAIGSFGFCRRLRPVRTTPHPVSGPGNGQWSESQVISAGESGERFEVGVAGACQSTLKSLPTSKPVSSQSDACAMHIDFRYAPHR